MDLMYIAQPSMAEDLKICFATVKILFMKDSTEGIAAGQTTAIKQTLGSTYEREKSGLSDNEEMGITKS